MAEFRPNLQAQTEGATSGRENTLENPGRRRFLQELGLLGMLAFTGCVRTGKPLGEIPRPTPETKEKNNFGVQWRQAMEAGIKLLPENKTLARYLQRHSHETIESLATMLRSFNIDDFLAREANFANLPPADVTGSIKDIFITSPRFDLGDGREEYPAIASDEELEIIMSPWYLKDGYFNPKNFQMIFGDEATHLLGFNADSKQNLWHPDPKQKKDPRAFNVPKNIYEGLIEFVALCGLPKEIKQNRLESYTGGATYGALALSELIGKETLAKIVLQKKPAQLGRALAPYLKKDTITEIFNSPLIPASYFQDDISAIITLHQLLKHLHREDKLDIKKINAAAWDFNISDQAHYFTKDGLSATIMLAVNNEADPPKLSLFGLVEPPAITIQNPREPKTAQNLVRPIMLLSPTIANPNPWDWEKESAQRGIDHLSRMADGSDQGYSETKINIDEYIKTRTARLSKGWQEEGWRPGQAEFDNLWQEIAKHAEELVLAGAKKLYSDAKVVDFVESPEAKAWLRDNK